MSIINALDGLAIDHEAILDDLLTNMHRDMFKAKTYKVLSVSGATRDSHRRIDATGITKVHNGQREVIRDAVNFEYGVVTETTNQPTEKVSVIKNGNELILYNEDTSIPWAISVNQVNRAHSNISDSLRKDLLSWLLYLKLGDTANVMGCLQRIDTTTLNTVAENAQARGRKVRPGKIRPCTL